VENDPGNANLLLTKKELLQRATALNIPPRYEREDFNAACLNGVSSVFRMVSVTDKDAACKQFASESCNNYHLRGQTDSQRIEYQTRVGKLAEFVAHRTLRSVFPNISEPDMEIYPTAGKSFIWDMRDERYNFAVKGFDCSSFDVPVSWTFQYRDTSNQGCDTHIFKRKATLNDYVVFVAIDMRNTSGRVVAVVPLRTLTEDHRFGLFELPVSVRLQKFKRVIYWDTLLWQRLDPVNSRRARWIADAYTKGNALKKKAVTVRNVPVCDVEPLAKTSMCKVPDLATPFRYPGAKTRMLRIILAHIKPQLTANTLYIEPFVGGGSVLIGAFCCGVKFQKALVNDADAAVAAFWECMCSSEKSQRLIQKVLQTEVTVEEHQRQRVLANSDDLVEKAYAALFLNRCSFSGIITAGPIGGTEQKSKWTVDCRYNAQKIAKQVRAVASKVSGNLEVQNRDFEGVISENDREEVIFYCDAPYYEKGNQLYRCKMGDKDHERLAESLKNLKHAKFVASYDACDDVLRLYPWARVRIIGARYSISGQNRDAWVRNKEFLICNF